MCIYDMEHEEFMQNMNTKLLEATARKRKLVKMELSVSRRTMDMTRVMPRLKKCRDDSTKAKNELLISLAVIAGK